MVRTRMSMVDRARAAAARTWQGLADPEVRTWSGWSPVVGGPELTVLTEDRFSPEQLRSLVGAGTGLEIDVTFSRFDFAVLEPVITELKSLRLHGVAKNLAGWDVLGSAAALEHLDFGGVKVPPAAVFDPMPNLNYLNVWGSAERLLAAAPNVRVLGLHATAAPSPVVAPITELLVSGSRVRDLRFLGTPDALVSIRVVSASDFDASSLLAAPRLRDIEFLMCRRVSGMAALADRDLDRFALTDVGGVDEPSALDSLRAESLLLDPDPRDPPSTAAPFTVSGSGARWTVWMANAGALADFAGRRGEEPSFYTFSDAVRAAFRTEAPDLMSQVSFDSEGGAFVVTTRSRSAAEAAVRIGRGLL